jgi:hypothetical protein
VRRIVQKRALLLLGLGLCVGACTEFPTRPANRRPTISSIVAFPNVIGQGDSLLVTVIASDPDGDDLVYDWETDSRLIIKGRPSWASTSLFNTTNRSQVFYRSTVVPVTDTAWIWCSARDGKGGGYGAAVHIPLRD